MSQSLQSPPAHAGRRIGQTQLHLPPLGFGGASVGNLYRASSDGEALSVLQSALQAGVTYFDTAPHYGHGLSEARIGAWLDQIGRDAIVLSTKVGRRLEPVKPGTEPDYGFVDPLPNRQVFDYSYDGVMRSFEASCQRLGTDHIDIIYMHDIGARTHGDDHEALFAQAMSGGFRALKDLKASQRVSAIGLGVNEWEVCAEALEAVEPDVFMVAGRFTLLENSAAIDFLETCRGRGVSVVSASPFNSGLMAKKPSSNARYDYGAPPADIVDRARRIHAICHEAGVRPQALALQFPLWHDAVISVVAGMSRPERVMQAVQWMGEAMDPDILERLIGAGLADPRLRDVLTVPS